MTSTFVDGVVLGFLGWWAFALALYLAYRFGRHMEAGP